MKPIVPILGLLVIAGFAGVAMASSGSSKKPAVLPNGGKPAEQALAAIATGREDTCRSLGVMLANEAPVVASALVRISQFFVDVRPLTDDVEALVISSVRSLDPAMMSRVATEINQRGHTALARDLTGVAGIVTWLQMGAPGDVDPAKVIPQPVVGPVAPVPTGALTAAEIAEITAALQSGDYDTMLRTAAKYRAKGNLDVAASLEAAAAQLKKTPPVTPVTPVTPDDTAARKLLAGKVVIAYKTATRVKGPGGILGATAPASAVEFSKAFQLAEGLSRVDGSYGSETALCLAERFGIVPPRPLYWGKKGGDYKTLQADKAQYNARITKLAQADKTRASEWAQALVK
jgi:hypothetical protein